MKALAALLVALVLAAGILAGVGRPGVPEGPREPPPAETHQPGPASGGGEVDCVKLAAELKAEQAATTDEPEKDGRATFEMVAVPEECKDELGTAGVNRR
ncbi:hypothetical protein J7E87_32455 [Streptomyces sp. ISL-1]|uniref:hypothetical protein n=1 Tax=Streptomyces sp. ISL-1 TaxID=2817657 RepID=UPI001BE7D609|nr:hypothetical protein [Streptomyces sp. ISL-1]MBT2393996.1 hypothetical protein [Streptomyces sp. ISL-1]